MMWAKWEHGRKIFIKTKCKNVKFYVKHAILKNQFKKETIILEKIMEHLLVIGMVVADAIYAEMRVDKKIKNTKEDIHVIHVVSVRKERPGGLK